MDKLEDGGSQVFEVRGDTEALRTWPCLDIYILSCALALGVAFPVGMYITVSHMCIEIQTVGDTHIDTDRRGP